jgi:hypothetical protein
MKNKTFYSLTHSLTRQSQDLFSDSFDFPCELSEKQRFF